MRYSTELLLFINIYNCKSHQKTQFAKKEIYINIFDIKTLTVTFLNRVLGAINVHFYKPLINSHEISQNA